MNRARAKQGLTLAVALSASACGVEQAFDLPPQAPKASAPIAAPVPSATAAEGAPAKNAPAPPEPVVVRFSRELESPVHHVALDKLPHVAALGAASVYVHDRRGWREEPLPQSVRSAENPSLEIFYGRDFRVRVVGTQTGANGVHSVYLRALPGGLKPAPEEIGRLGNSRNGALVAVLGTADPEVVCRPGELCLIKRISGWASLPAPNDLTRAAIAGGAAYAVAGRRLLRAGEKDWSALSDAGPFQEATALFALLERVFVLESPSKKVHAFAEGVWRSFDSPVGTPYSMWGASLQALWLVGADGVAHYDGTGWRPVKDAPAGLRAVLGRSADDVWFGGSSGLYRVQPSEGSP